MTPENQSWPPPPQQPFGSYAPDPNAIPPRHGCFTAWLIVALIAQVLTLLLNSLGYNLIHRGLPSFTPLIAGLLVLGGLLHIACIVALFQWRRWGFYGIVVITVLICVLNIMVGVSIGGSLSSLVGVGILYGVLNIGGPNSAWRHLK